MRVSPINNFNKLPIANKSKKMEKPTTESIQNTDNISFKSNYETVFREGLRKKITTMAEYKELFKDLTNSVKAIPHVLISKKMNQSINDDYFLARNQYERILKSSNADEVILFKTANGVPLVTVDKEAIEFLPLNNNYDLNRPESYSGDYFRFYRDEDMNCCLTKPERDITLWWPAGTLKQDISYVDRNGTISHNHYYNKDGTLDKWKTFFLGSF